MITLGWCCHCKAYVRMHAGEWAVSLALAAEAIGIADECGDFCLLSWTTLMFGECVVRALLADAGDAGDAGRAGRVAGLEHDPGDLVGGSGGGGRSSDGAVALCESARRLATVGIGVLTCATELFRCMPELYGVASSQLLLGTLHCLRGEAGAAVCAFATNLDGFCPVHLAVISCRPFCFRCALSCSSRLGVFDHQGYSVLDYARMANRGSMEELVLSTAEGAQLKRDSDMKQRMRSAVATLHAARDSALSSGERLSRACAARSASGSCRRTAISLRQ
jgi:hypothetical protein